MNNFFWSHNNQLKIGDNYQGGIIYYILQSDDYGYDANVQHGLITTTSDNSTGIVWRPTGQGDFNFASSLEVGYGKANTDGLVAVYGNDTYAAKMCVNLSLNGFTDWFLPSRQELVKMMFERSYLSLNDNVAYWASTDWDSSDGAFDYNYAWSTIFNGESATSTLQLKTESYRVRAIRQF